MKVLVFDAFNGAGGDMIVASLLDVSLSPEDLKGVVEALKLDIRFDVKRVNMRGINAKRVEVRCCKTEREFREVLEIIDSSDLSDDIKNASKEIFEIIAKAEAKIHGCKYDEAVFHEVGCDDAIFDVVCSVVGLNRLAKDGFRFFANPIRLGSGFIDISHGKYPIPAPATLEILKNSKLEVLFDGEGELLTPTAAAILSYYCGGVLRYPLRVKEISYGAGSRNTEIPNVLRVIIGEVSFRDNVAIIETNLDDVSGELIGFALEELWKINGVLDVSTLQGIGKKCRPSTLVRVLCKLDRAEEVAKEVMKLTGTLGVRIIPIYHRELAYREVKNSEVELDGKKFKIRVKYSKPYFNHIKPEFEDVAKIAKEIDKPIVEVYRKIIARLEDVDTERE